MNRRTVIMSFGFFCRGSILPRAKSLTYISSIEDIVYCKPEVANNNGITILRIDERLFAKLKKLGADIDGVWDQKKYNNTRNADILKWINMLPFPVWGNRHFNKKLNRIRNFSAEISRAITDNQFLFDTWEHIKK